MIINGGLGCKGLFTLQHLVLQPEDNSTPGAATWSFLLIQSIVTSTVPLENQLRGQKMVTSHSKLGGGDQLFSRRLPGQLRKEIIDRVGWDCNF